MVDPARQIRTFEQLYDEILQLPEGLSGEILEVYQTINGLPTLVTTAQEAERRVLPPFELEISLERWWLPGPPLTE